MAKRDPIAFDQTFTLDENNDVAIAFEASISVNAQRNIARLGDKIARRLDKISSQEAKIASQQAKIVALEQKIAAAEADGSISKREAKLIERAEKKIAKAEDRIADSEQKIAESEQKISEFEASIESLQTGGTLIYNIVSGNDDGHLAIHNEVVGSGVIGKHHRHFVCEFVALHSLDSIMFR